MTLIACPVPGKAKSKMLCEAFIAGAPRSAEGFVFYGVKSGNYPHWLEARASGKDWYFIDNSYFDSVRGVQFRVAKNRLQHDGRGLTDCRRFAALPETVMPWVSRPDGYALVVVQSMDHYKHVLRLTDDWLPTAVSRRKGPVRIRHWCADKPGLANSFQEDLAGANVLVTHTSAAAVMAVLAGVPADCDPACAAWEIEPWTDDDRVRWAGVLADNQWTIDEMKKGLAWRTLNPT